MKGSAGLGYGRYRIPGREAKTSPTPCVFFETNPAPAKLITKASITVKSCLQTLRRNF